MADVEEETGLPVSTVVKVASEYLPAGVKVSSLIAALFFLWYDLPFLFLSCHCRFDVCACERVSGVRMY